MRPPWPAWLRRWPAPLSPISITVRVGHVTLCSLSCTWGCLRCCGRSWLVHAGDWDDSSLWNLTETLLLNMQILRFQLLFLSRSTTSISLAGTPSFTILLSHLTSPKQQLPLIALQPSQVVRLPTFPSLLSPCFYTFLSSLSISLSAPVFYCWFKWESEGIIYSRHLPSTPKTE